MTDAIIQGDCRDLLDWVEPGTVDVVVTSPPYYSQRSYVGADSVWSDGYVGQLGLEPTPELFISHLVECFRPLKVAMKPYGVCWVDIGDKFSADQQLLLIPARFALAMQEDGWRLRQDMIWAKNPMPESVAGWSWQRHKVKVGESHYDLKTSKWKGTGQERRGVALGPGSTCYRPEKHAKYIDCPGCPRCAPNGGYVLRKGSWRATTAHEHIFMFTLSDQYYADGEAVRTPNTQSSRDWGETSSRFHGNGETVGRHKGFYRVGSVSNGANLRSVVSFKRGRSYTGGGTDHYAQFPVSLPTLLIQASTSARGYCPKCGMPWTRVVERDWKHQEQAEREMGLDEEETPTFRGGHRNDGLPYEGKSKTIGWRPSCTCQDAGDPVQGVVCDIFNGVGTTCVAAKMLGRNWIGIDISEEYCKMAEERVVEIQEPLMVADV